MGGENEFFAQELALFRISARLTAPLHHKNGVTASLDSLPNGGGPSASRWPYERSAYCGVRF
ncbi:MAG: hypothetical protein LBT00_04825 [Spirochaetaceae bacterium]|nr:hypothetical protein [Spirochaetaceae bacterium]